MYFSIVEFRKFDFLWKILMCKIFFQNGNSIFLVAHCIFLQSLNVYKLSPNWNLHVCCMYIIQVILAPVQFHSQRVRPRSNLIKIRVPKSPTQVSQSSLGPKVQAVYAWNMCLPVSWTWYPLPMKLNVLQALCVNIYCEASAHVLAIHIISVHFQAN